MIDPASQKLSDPLVRLELGLDDKNKAAAKAPALVRLEELNSRMKTDGDMSKLLRARFRSEKRKLTEAEAEAKSKGLALTLLPASAADVTEASGVQYQTASDPAKRIEQERRKRVKLQSIFDTTSFSGTRANGLKSGVASFSAGGSGGLSTKDRLGLLRKLADRAPAVSSAMIRKAAEASAAAMPLARTQVRLDTASLPAIGARKPERGESRPGSVVSEPVSALASLAAYESGSDGDS